MSTYLKTYHNILIHVTAQKFDYFILVLMFFVVYFRMKSYITENTQSDALVIGVNQSENPFRDQKSCAIL